MTPEIQTILALALVAAAALWLVRRWLTKRNRPGCGSDCACPTNDLKAKLKP
jgi:hypothetical protein